MTPPYAELDVEAIASDPSIAAQFADHFLAGFLAHNLPQEH